MKKTDYIELTELWNDGHYGTLGDIMRKERWEMHRIAEFCAYFSKYCGTTQLEILHKFL